MSENAQPGFGTEDASVAQLAEAAGRPRVDPDNPVNQLRDHCKAFIAGQQIKDHCRSMALTKLDEFCFWLRAGMGRG